MLAFPYFALIHQITFLLQLLELLREQDFGVFEGRSFPEFKKEAVRNGFAEGDAIWAFVPEEGETHEAVRGRGAKFMDVRRHFCSIKFQHFL